MRNVHPKIQFCLIVMKCCLSIPQYICNICGQYGDVSSSIDFVASVTILTFDAFDIVLFFHME